MGTFSQARHLLKFSFIDFYIFLYFGMNHNDTVFFLCVCLVLVLRVGEFVKGTLIVR